MGEACIVSFNAVIWLCVFCSDLGLHALEKKRGGGSMTFKATHGFLFCLL